MESDLSLALFQGATELYLQQRKEWVEIVVDWETSNRYAILNASREELGMVAERAGTFWIKLRRWLLRSHRGFEADVFDKMGKVLLHLSRGFFFFFSDLNVYDGQGQRLGRVERRFGIFFKKYDLLDNSNQCFATIRSPFWKIWTFPIQDTRGQECAVVSKKWGGMREVFTDADTFKISFGNTHWTKERRAVVFAAAVSIDFDFFENNQGVGGFASLIPDFS